MGRAEAPSLRHQLLATGASTSHLLLAPGAQSTGLVPVFLVRERSSPMPAVQGISPLLGWVGPGTSLQVRKPASPSPCALTIPSGQLRLFGRAGRPPQGSVEAFADPPRLSQPDTPAPWVCAWGGKGFSAPPQFTKNRRLDLHQAAPPRLLPFRKMALLLARGCNLRQLLGRKAFSRLQGG